MAKHLTLTEASNFLKSNDNYCILTHRRPDGDTLGSAAGLCLALRSIGKAAYVAANPEAAGRYEVFVRELTPPIDFVPESVISVDTAAKDLLPKAFETLAGRVKLSIDHHSNGGTFSENILLAPECAATGELVVLLLNEMGIALTMDIACALYIAIATDTGCLRYENTTARTLRIAADLKDAGVDTTAINTEFFEKKTFSRLALEAALMEDAEILPGGRIAVLKLSFDKMMRTNATLDDTDNISALARMIAGVEAGVMLREESDGTIKVSLRTGRDYDAGKICAKLGGGGHARAAGCTIKANINEAREIILKTIEEV
jgi:phosphoesterase RecJ-like protein